jgi:hypothetical protein
MFPEFNNTQDVIAIYSGYVAGPNGYNSINCDFSHVEQYLISRYSPGTRIVFDNLHEGGMDDLVYKIHEMLDNTNIDGKDIYYFTGLADAKEQYESFCSRNQLTKRINVAGANPFELAASRQAQQFSYYQPKVELKEKNFICFNRIWRAHRYMLVGLLLDENLVKNSYYSYFPNNSYRSSAPFTEDSIYRSAAHVIQDSELSSRIQNTHMFYNKLFPLTINITPEHNKTHVDHEDIELFVNSYFSLVTETFFFNHDLNVPHLPHLKLFREHGIFFSEKIFKPIIMKHPFILAARPNSLEYLRKSGYKTFHPLIDETYDTIENNNDRMLAIVKEVKRLSAFSKDEWLKWQEQIQEICKYNHEVLANKRDFIYVRHYV